MDIQLILDQILLFLKDLGLIGLFAAILLEGASVPFPGIIVVLAYGSLLDLSFAERAGTAVVMGVVYSLASLIPYFVGNKMEHLLGQKIRKGLKKAGHFFHRYGIWSIALSRPFGVGNYISYLAGISNVKLVKYLLLTFIGIFPWCFAILCLGDYLNGNYDRFLSLFNEYKLEFYGIGLLLAILFTAYTIWNRRRKERT